MTTWSYDWFPLPGQAMFDRNRQKLAAVSRAPGNLDLFIVGNDSRVWSTFWTQQGGWSHDWFPLPGQAVFDRNVQKVAAVSRAPGNLTCSSLAMIAASGRRSGRSKAAGATTGFRCRVRPCSIATSSTSQRCLARPATSTCSSLAMITTSGRRSGAATLEPRLVSAAGSGGVRS